MEFKLITNKKDKRNKQQEEQQQQQHQRTQQQHQAPLQIPPSDPQIQYPAKLSIKLPASPLDEEIISSDVQASSSYCPPTYSTLSSATSLSTDSTSSFAQPAGRPPMVRTSSVSSHFNNTLPSSAASLVSLRSCPVQNGEYHTPPSPRSRQLLKTCSENDRSNRELLDMECAGQSTSDGEASARATHACTTA